MVPRETLRKMDLPPERYVVLRVKKDTPYEWSGVLTDGRRLYARSRNGSWCVRVGTEPGEDAISGTEVAVGIWPRTLTYRGLKAKTKGVVLWPPRLDRERSGTEATIVRTVVPAGPAIVEIAEKLDVIG